MKSLKKPSKTIVFAAMMVILIIPFLQNLFDFIDIAPLKGSFEKAEKKEISLSGWFSDDYQQNQEKYINQNFGFRNLFVRLNNQIAFDLFNVAKANQVIVGKDNYLYEKNYLLASSGIDFIGADSVKHRMQRLKFIQDELQKRNKTLLVVFTAGKASFYPEYIPKEYATNNRPTNYECHIKACKEQNINFIDFNDYFIKHKETSQYPLYPQYGIHWSYYGMCLAVDSIVHRIEGLRNINMPEIYWDSIKMDLPREGDYDIADGMNLLFKLKREKMAYPIIKIKDETSATKPSAIVIGDSFYWQMYNFTPRVFSDNHFWYYYRDVYPNSSGKSVIVDDLNFENEMEQHDVFILMSTEANLSKFGWGFIDDAYKLFKYGENQNPEAFKAKVEEVRKYIKSDKKWMEIIIEKARKQNISVDSMLMKDAIWVAKNKN